jgi:hypothetical protein
MVDWQSKQMHSFSDVDVRTRELCSTNKNLDVLLSKQLQGSNHVGYFRFPTKEISSNQKNIKRESSRKTSNSPSAFWKTYASTTPFSKRTNWFRAKVVTYKASKSNTIKFCVGATTDCLYRDSSQGAGVFLGGVNDTNLSWSVNAKYNLMHRGEYTSPNSSGSNEYISCRGALVDVILDFETSYLKFYVDGMFIGMYKVPLDKPLYPAVSSMGYLLFQC